MVISNGRPHSEPTYGGRILDWRRPGCLRWSWAGFLYLAVEVEAWSRRVIGRAMESHLGTELVVARWT
jgi:hypothetical protein